MFIKGLWFLHKSPGLCMCTVPLPHCKPWVVWTCEHSQAQGSLSFSHRNPNVQGDQCVLSKVLNAYSPGWHQEPQLPTQCPRSQMSIYPERQYLVKASDQCKAWQRLKVTPVPLQTLGFPCVTLLPKSHLCAQSKSLCQTLVGEGGVQYGRRNAVPNMVSMEGRKVPEPLTVPTSFLAPPLIPSLRRQWTHPPSFQQLPAPSWRRPSS